MKDEKIFSGRETIQLIKQLIRYDIPFLLLGISSIGKSYSILDMASRWRMPHSILYIGSEKPSNIEGLPRLVGRRSETGDMLEFFKPNWFPNSLLIGEYLKNGKKIYEQFAQTAYSGEKSDLLNGSNFNAMNEVFEGLFQWKWSSNTIQSQEMILSKIGTADGVLNKAFVVSRELLDERQLFEKTTENPNYVQKDEVRDLSLYLSTILGYGNFWLILDELDKVDENEKDKYAPLLHIVRERIIKNYSMRTLNSGNGAGVPFNVEKGSYSNIKQQIDLSIEKGFPVLDTRIIGIANATANIEEALFRRFLHIIVEEVMMVSDPPKQLADMRNCLSRVTESIMEGQNQFLANLEFKLLSEVNLQWQFNFFPKLINRNDAKNNYIIDNLLRKISLASLSNIKEKLRDDFSPTSIMLKNSTADSALFKIVRNNYGLDDEINTLQSSNFQTQIYGCLVAEVLNQSLTSDLSQGASSAQIGTEELIQEANSEEIQEALKMFSNEPIRASKYIIAKNRKQYTELEKNNASIMQYVTDTMDLVEASKGTTLQDNLFTGLLCNAYYGVIFSTETIDFKNTISTYINEFSKIAQNNGFSWSNSEKSIKNDALNLLQLQEDTLAMVQKGSGELLNAYNKELASNFFMSAKKVVKVDNLQALKDLLVSLTPIVRRLLPSQMEFIYLVIQDDLVIKLKAKNPEQTWMSAREKL
jgi:hypothetical protein